MKTGKDGGPSCPIQFPPTCTTLVYQSLGEKSTLVYTLLDLENLVGLGAGGGLDFHFIASLVTEQRLTDR